MRRTAVVLATLATITWASSGRAQVQHGFSLDRFYAAPPGDRFFGVQGDDAGGHGDVRVAVLGDYAYHPLDLSKGTGAPRRYIVTHQLFLHPALAVSLWQRLSISVDVPIALYAKGNSPTLGTVSYPSPSGVSLGDVRAGTRVRIVGDPGEAFQLGLAAYLFIPSGDDRQYDSEPNVRGLPALVVSGETTSFAYAVNLGVLARNPRKFDTVTIGPQAVAGLGAAVLLANRKLQIGPEIYGSTTFDEAFKRDTMNAEAILGIKLRMGPMLAGIAAGPGLTRKLGGEGLTDGTGTPQLRAVASLTYAREGVFTPPAPPDTDGDGVADPEDACPDVPGAHTENPETNGCPRDTDGDGVVDRLDACPAVPGRRNENPEKNGCPPDRDNDSVVDAIDACPDQPGIATLNPKTNGCPPSDRDNDGVLDDDDACPTVAGPKDDDPKKNGCPLDSDGDGIADDVDACPNDKGKRSPDPNKNGCPTVRVTEQEIVILQQVKFKSGKEVILPESDALLGEVAAALSSHPDITLLEVQGHTDNRGGAANNKKLSKKRAAAVLKWLVTRGNIDRTRLTSNGYGMSQPIASNSTEEGRAANRRVQFKIIERSEPIPK